MKRDYPFGRTLEDSVAQPFRNLELAERCREIMQRMTGEECDLVPRGSSCWYLVRFTGERWIRV